MSKSSITLGGKIFQDKIRRIIKMTTSTDAQFHSSNHQKWLSNQILGGKTVKHSNRSTNNGNMVDKTKRDVIEFVIFI